MAVTVFGTAVSSAAPLTVEAIAGAKKIGLFPGTFDPITPGHIQIAEDAAKKFGLDLVILMPNISTWHKIPLPLEERLKMITIVANESKVVQYPETDAPREAFAADTSYVDNSFATFIRSVNPNASLYAILGEDIAERALSILLLKHKLNPDFWLVACRTDGACKPPPLVGVDKVGYLNGFANISSSQARDFLRSNPQLYFSDNSDGTDLSPSLDPRLAQYILERGLYLDNSGSNRVPLPKRIKNFVTNIIKNQLIRWNLYEDFKELAVRLRRQMTVDPSSVDGLDFEPVRYLGSGLSSDAFLVRVGGELMVLKLANGRPNSRASIQRSIPVHLWALNKSGILVPEVKGYDPEGHWLLTSFIGGKSLADFLLSGERLNAAQTRSLRRLHSQALDFRKQLLINLDISADNIVLNGDDAYLIDLGPIPRYASLETNFSKLLDRWIKKYSPPCDVRLAPAVEY